MKHAKLLKWADRKVEKLTDELTSECMICDIVNGGDHKIANQVWNKKHSPELGARKREFRKRTKGTRINQWNINRRLGQLSLLHVSYRTILLDTASSDIEKTEAQHQLVKINRLKNLYYANVQDYISNLNVNAKVGQDYLEIILFAFVPASFVTGYFGMNFTSMGNPGKNSNSNGLLVSKYGHYFAVFMVLFFCIMSYIFVSNNFFNEDVGRINTIKRFNELLNMPYNEDYFEVEKHAKY